jgi:3-phenylpropionate/cinnamic acid dioxygenase small subunit
MVTNILIEDGDNDDELRVFSNFLVRQARKLREEAWWAGRRKDVLRRENGGWKIARREILLDSIVLPRGISIFF